MNAVDTNVLIYVHDPRDRTKQAQATQLIGSIANGVLLWQVACEYVGASRKLQAFGFSPQDAWNDLRRLRTLWNCILPAWNHHLRCEALMQRHSLSFWDALLIAAALEEGVQNLYSEDLAGAGKIPGIHIINPFGP